MRKRPNFEYIALTMCAVFGWTLPQVFDLTWPQFVKISTEVRSLQFARAKNEVRLGICAAISGGESEEALNDIAGSFLIDDEPQLEYTEEEYQRALERQKEILRKQRELEEKQKEKQNGI